MRQVPGRSSAAAGAPSQRTLNGIELRLLRAFVATAEELHFGRAAARLHVSQPALSRQIRHLERQLGCALLDRSTHHVALTSAGDALLAGIRPVLGDVDRAVAAARDADTGRHPRLEELVAPLVDAAARGADVPTLRRAFEDVLATQPLPDGVDVRPLNAAGVPCLTVTASAARRGSMVHLHGGGGVMGSAFGYRALAAALSEATGRAVVLTDHRLAPEHPWSASIADADAVLERVLGWAAAAHDVVLSGDGAGARLALDVLVRRRDRGLPMPGRTVLMEPWLDSVDVRAAPRHGSVSPLHAVRLSMSRHLQESSGEPPSWDLRGMPPVLLQSGSDGSSQDADRRFVDRARTVGHSITYERYPAAMSPLHVFWDHLPEAARALSRIAAFLQGDGDLVTGGAGPGQDPLPPRPSRSAAPGDAPSA